MEDIILIRPDWPAPGTVSACVTTRSGGHSPAPYNSLNLGEHVGDRPLCVQRNRKRLAEFLDLPGEPKWLQQVHGTSVVDAALSRPGVTADASFSREPGAVCAVMTADCLPVFFCSDDGDEIALAHGGWRGLAAGVLESTVNAMRTPPARILAWLGPAIGPGHFEVGEEVRAAFEEKNPTATQAFRPSAGDRWLADIYALARQQLKKTGVKNISGGNECTFQDHERFYSYRRDGHRSGRMASLIWMR